VTIRVDVSGQDKLAALAARLMHAAATLQTRLTDAVREESRPALADVQAAWMGVEVTSTRGGGSSSGLRGRVAAATEARPIAQGSSFHVDSGRVNPRYDLVTKLDGLERWRHPVFGNRRAWTEQSGQEVFYATLQSHEQAWESRLDRECDQVAREIEG
jgi:hypothetical protein